MAQRKRFIKSALKKKYRRFLVMPPWTDSELASLGDGLRSSVIAANVIREMVLERIAY